MRLRKLNEGLSEHSFFISISSCTRTPLEKRWRLLAVTRLRNGTLIISVEAKNGFHAFYAQIEPEAEKWVEVCDDHPSLEAMCVSDRAPLYQVRGIIPEHIE